MTFEQAAILILLIAMLAVFALDRLRMEVVALAGLGLGFALKLVPASGLFSGFADPAVVTVIEVLLVVQVLSRSSLLDRLAGRIASKGLGERATIAILCAIAASISVFMNNIGALALMIPVLYGVGNAAGIAPRRMLMPVSFATLLGGICSEIGTPANLIVSGQLAGATGHGFALFDFAWAGIPAAVAGLAAIASLLPRRLPPAEEKAAETGSASRTVMAVVSLPAGSLLAGHRQLELPFMVHSAHRGGIQLFLAAKETTVQPGDLLFLEAPESRLRQWLGDGELILPGAASTLPVAQAVVMPQSTVLGSRAGGLHAFASRGIRVVAVSPRTVRIERTLDDIRLSIGDILYLDGPADRVADAIAEAEMLPIAGEAPAEPRPASAFGLAVFCAGILLAATSLVPPQVAFGAVVLVLAAAGTLDLRTAIGALPWPILIMLAAMIPLGNAIETTGAAKVLADALVSVAPPGSGVFLTGAMLLLALLVTPFVNNASTVIVLGPIAIDAARAAGIPPEPLLIAVAMGASIDFLTPFGHHNNTLVMGLGAYRFVDFPRAGWLVTLATATTGLVFIAWAWAA